MIQTTLTRRTFGAAFMAGATLALMPAPVMALDVAGAQALIDRALAEVNRVINSGKSEAAMYKDFEAIFVRYADVNAIARSALGPAARSATPAQMKAFTKAYQAYISRKYGRRFREFTGSKIEVTSAKAVKSYYEVKSVAKLKGSDPMDLRWYVSNKSGRDLFFNIMIEGVNMLASEREEVGAMLKQSGSIEALITQLNAR